VHAHTEGKAMLTFLCVGKMLHIETFLDLIQVKAILFTVISDTFYYSFLGSTPFEIACSS